MPAKPAGLTHARVLKIALPIVLSNVTVPLLGMVDTGVVGQMGQAAPIAAVGVGAVLISMLVWIFGFLRMGTTGMAAQALGAGDAPEANALLVRGLLIGLTAGLVLIAAQGALIWLAFQLAPVSPEVEDLARTYLQIRIWGAPATIALYAVTGWLIAVERTRAVFVLQLWMNGLNIVLDLWFVLGLDWGVAGVARATLLAEATGLMLGLWICRAVFQTPGWLDPSRILNPARLRRMMAVNGDIMVRSLSLQAIFASFLLLGGRFGDLTLAANQVLLQFLHISSYALDGFAFAAEALVGQAVGAGQRRDLRRAAWLSGVWSAASAVLATLVFWTAGGAIIDLMTTAPDVRETARSYLPYAASAPLLGWAAFVLDGVFIGATATRDMRNMMLLSLGIYVLAAAALIPLIGNHGLWAAMLISFLARAASLGARYPALERRVG